VYPLSRGPDFRHFFLGRRDHNLLRSILKHDKLVECERQLFIPVVYRHIGRLALDNFGRGFIIGTSVRASDAGASGQNEDAEESDEGVWCESFLHITLLLSF